MVVFADKEAEKYDFLATKLGVAITAVNITYDT